MYNVILVDNEQPALRRLGKLIAAHTEFQVTGTFTRAAEALSAVPALMPDVAFLDIEMPGIGGLELAARLTEIYPDLKIVMVTAFSEYALQAFRVNAVDYLVKPVSPEDIVKCAKKLKRLRYPAQASVPGPADVPARITGFNGFELHVAASDSPVRFVTAKCEELFAYLLVNRDVQVAKRDLCADLWPELDADKAEQNLHTSIYRLKRTFSEQRLPVRLESQRGSYRLYSTCRCDFLDSELMSNACEEWGEDDLAAMEAVVGQYRGPLFAGKAYAWCEPLRERLERRYSLLSKRLADYHFAAGRDGQAMELLSALIAVSPYDEQGYELQLAAFARRGERVPFLQLYRKMEKLLRTELGLEPSPSVRSLYKQMTDIS